MDVSRSRPWMLAWFAFALLPHKTAVLGFALKARALAGAIRGRAPAQQIGAATDGFVAGGAAASEQYQVLAVAEKAAREAGSLILAGRGAEVRKTKANPRDLLTEVDGAAQRVIEACVRAAFPAHGFLGEESVEAGQAASALALGAALEGKNRLQSTGAEGGEGDWLWVVDPIDGTTNFASGLTLSTVSIGVAYKGELAAAVVYDPFMDELFSAGKGMGAACNGVPMRVARGPPSPAASRGGEAEAAEEAAEEVLQEAVVFAGSPPSINSMMPSLRGVNALMPKVRTVRMVGSAALMLAWVAAGRAQAYFEADLNAWDSAAGALLIHEAGGTVVDLKTLAPYSLATRRILATNGDPCLVRALHRELRAASACDLDPTPGDSGDPSDAVAAVTGSGAASEDSPGAKKMSALEAEEMEERGRAFDRNRAQQQLAEKDPEVEAKREAMLQELDQLLKLGRDGVVKKLERELGDKVKFRDDSGM